mgnify:CR=1 FL=1|jgi:hypothetical protein
MGDPDQRNQTEPHAIAEDAAGGVPQWVKREDARAREDEREATADGMGLVMRLVVPLVFLIAGGLISLFRP